MPAYIWEAAVTHRNNTVQRLHGSFYASSWNTNVAVAIMYRKIYTDYGYLGADVLEYHLEMIDGD